MWYDDFWPFVCGTHFHIINGRTLSPCFRKVAIEFPIHFIMIVICAYFIGLRTNWISRMAHHFWIINIRMLATFLILLLTILRTLLRYLYSSNKLVLIDFIMLGVVSLCWISHIIYLQALKVRITPQTRGPMIVIFCWILTLFASILELRACIINNADYLVEVISNSFIIFFHCIYLITLLPAGNTDASQYQDFNTINDERHSILISSTSAIYGRFREEEDPLNLGIAEDQSSIFSRLFFNWTSKLINKGFNGQLKYIEDLFELPHFLRANDMSYKFHPYLSRQQLKKTAHKYSLFLALNKYFGLKYYSFGLLKLASDCLSFAGPVILNYLVNFLEQQTEPVTNGYWYTAALFAVTFLGTLTLTQFNFFIGRLGMRIRTVLVITIYNKSLTIQQMCANPGQIINYMSTDVDRIVNFCQSFHSFWSLPFQIVVTLYLIYCQVGKAFLAGTIIAILLVPLNQIIATRIARFSGYMMNKKDERIKVLNEVFIGMKAIKMQAMEDIFMAKVTDLRKQEIKWLKLRKYYDAGCVFLWAATPVLVSISTFVTYVLLGNTLTAAKAFTSLALFNLLISPLNAFPWVLNGLMEAWVSLKRVQTFLNALDVEKETTDDLLVEDEVFRVKDAFFSWPQARGFILGPLTFTVKQGEFIGITGRMGSGKSTLAMGLINELKRVSGEFLSVSSDIGIVTQDPWLQQATIKNNIVLNKALVHSRYRAVLSRVALVEDLQALPNGDETEIGDNGITLSGGQKARIALARALYQDFSVYILDDPFASLDPAVAKQIYEKCLLNLISTKTVILITHHTEFLEKADQVFVLDNGVILKQGSPSEVLPNYSPSKFEPGSIEEIKSNLQSAMSIPSIDSGNDLISEEEKLSGNVKPRVYRAYLKAVGTFLGIVILIICLLMQASKSLADWWLAFWVNCSQANNTNISLNDYMQRDICYQKDVRFFITVYGIIGIVCCLFTLLRAFLYAYGGIRAALNLHTQLLNTVMMSPITFFFHTPIGRILNRFSSDVFTIDDSLPFTFNILLAQIYSLSGTILITCIGIPWILVLLVPLGGVYYRIQKYYRCTSRELKRLASLTLSPIYSHFAETISGQIIIRSYGAISKFCNDSMDHLDRNQTANYCAMAISQWLNLRLQLIGVILVTGVALFSVLEYHFLTSINAGLVGLALSYALSVTSLLSGVVTYFTETEKEMVSVERTCQYIDGLSPETQEGDQLLSEPRWPQLGVVVFRCVKLRYRAGQPPALNIISFETHSAEKLAIIGRTGSGKSSIFQALFRMVEIEQGSIFIDGINISTINLQKLRSSISLITQDPFLLSGTLRQNLDPRGIHSDDDLYWTLSKASLSLELDMEILEQGKNLSAGQKQLICLARALLLNSKIICIDEATAQVDQETEQIIISNLKALFPSTTVLIIAHRMETVKTADRVLVLDNGTIISETTPTGLLKSPSTFLRWLDNQTDDENS